MLQTSAGTVQLPHRFPAGLQTSRSAVGGPALTVLFMRLPSRRALIIVCAIVLLGNVLAALSTGYAVMGLARVISGVASQAFFGLGISLSARIVDANMRGRASRVAMTGLMLSTLLGLPLATFIDGQLGWRAAFWVISAITVLAAILTLKFVRDPEASDAEALETPTIPTLLIGTALNTLFLTGFAINTDAPPLALAFMFGVGLVGVTMNPAMAVRIQRTGSTAPLVNTIHASFITLGVVLGSAGGSALIPRFGLRAPLVLGATLAVLAIATILPAPTTHSRADSR